MKVSKKVLLVLAGILAPVFAFAADPTTASGVTDAVTAIPTGATTTYIAAAVLGLGILTVSIAVYVLRRGVKMR